MDPEKMLEIINEVRARQEKDPMTLDEYNSISNADNDTTKKYKAAQEAGRRFHVRYDVLRNKYHVPNSPVNRCYYFLMKEEKTPEDEEYNKNIAEKASTPEGSAELFEDMVRRAAELPPSVFFPKDDFEMISNYEKYGGLMDALFTIHHTRADFNSKFGINISPEVGKFLDNHSGVFDLFGKMSGMVNLWASPFYPVFGEPDINNVTDIMLSEKKEAPGVKITPEQSEFNIFSQSAFVPTQYDAEKDVIKGGRKLVESDKLNEHKYASENIYDAAKKSAEEDEGVTLKTLDEDGRRALDKELSGRFAMTAAQKEAKDARDAREVLDEGALSQGTYSFEKADYRLLKLFGPEFEYDEEQLKTESYTKDNFKVDDYKLPENCPFSESEAAFIGLYSMSLKGIGDLSRPNMSDINRLEGNFSFLQENMITGTFRFGLGAQMHASVKKAREAVPDIIEKYMQGDKTVLAEALANGIHISAQFFIASEYAGLTNTFEGRNMTRAMELIRRDPELGRIIKDKKLLSEKDIKAAKIGSVMNRYFEERGDCLKRFHDELEAGRQPSDELKQELITRVLTFNLIKGQKEADNKLFLNSDDFNKKAEEIMKNPDPIETNAQLETFTRTQPISAFQENLIKTGGLETLENMVKNSYFAKELMKKSCKELVQSLKLSDATPDRTSDMTKNLRKELDGLKTFTEKVVMDIKDTYTPATRESIAEDIQILSELGKGMEDAQKNVHMGSGEFDKVVKDIKLLEEAGKGLRSGQYLLDGKNAGNMRLMYAGLQKHCEAYLARKEKQGLLDADPESKPGKRIKMVREVLKFSQQGEARFGASEEEAKTFRSEADKILYDSLAPESAAAMMKKLNELAGNNSDPEYGEKIVHTLNLVVKYMNEKNVQSENIGLEQKDYENAAKVIKNKGVGKKPEKAKDNVKTEKKQAVK